MPPEAPERDTDLLRRLASYAASVAALLTEPDRSHGGRRFTRGVAIELAMDYVEELAGWACGAGGAWRLLRQLALAEELDWDHPEQPWRVEDTPRGTRYVRLPR